MSREPGQKGLRPKIFNLEQSDRQTITVKQHKVESRKNCYQSSQDKGARPCGVYMMQLCFLLVGPNEFQTTMPPSCGSRPVRQGRILPCVLCQVSIVDHDIHRVKFLQVSTLTQYVFKDGLPVGVSNLSCSVILQGCSRTEFGPRVPCNKPGTCIKATPTKGITRKVSTEPITKLLKSNTLGGRSAGGNSRESDLSFTTFLTILVRGTTRRSSSRLLSGIRSADSVGEMQMY